jgi:hypothetical protein
VTSANAPCQRERLKSAHWGKLDSTRPFLLVTHPQQQQTREIARDLVI